MTSTTSRRWVLLGAVLSAALATLVGCAGSGKSAPSAPQPKNPRDVTAWSPSVTPTSGPITEQQQSQSRLEQVAQILRIHNLPEPASEAELPPLVRRVSLEDSGPLAAQCLTEHGFPSTSTGGIVVTKDLADEQNKAWAKVRADCTAQYPVDAKYTQQWGADQWKVDYEYLVDYYIPCVESFGVSIDKDTIPEERAFIEAGLSGGDVWHPVFDWAKKPEYRALNDENTPEGAELAEVCRQSAPSNKLWG
ncbi:hypothetical protein [Trueperella pyogenes]|uniref:hypothetical protein n=1 Tax=Trueperella pyogenes TaxID=1661 RepID=UPI0023DDC5FD|nr:hypothetical protein [Trueperella pyogenes]